MSEVVIFVITSGEEALIVKRCSDLNKLTTERNKNKFHLNVVIIGYTERTGKIQLLTINHTQLYCIIQTI